MKKCLRISTIKPARPPSLWTASAPRCRNSLRARSKCERLVLTRRASARAFADSLDLGIWGGSLSKSNKIWGKEQQKNGGLVWIVVWMLQYRHKLSFHFEEHIILQFRDRALVENPRWLDVPKSWGCPFTKFVVSEFNMLSTIENSNYKTQLKKNHATHQ